MLTNTTTTNKASRKADNTKVLPMTDNARVATTERVKIHVNGLTDTTVNAAQVAYLRDTHGISQYAAELLAVSGVLAGRETSARRRAMIAQQAAAVAVIRTHGSDAPKLMSKICADRGSALAWQASSARVLTANAVSCLNGDKWRDHALTLEALAKMTTGEDAVSFQTVLRSVKEGHDNCARCNPATSTPATSTPATSTPATSTPATSTPATMADMLATVATLADMIHTRSGELSAAQADELSTAALLLCDVAERAALAHI